MADDRGIFKDAFAGKPTPTGFGGVHAFCATPPILMGAGLPANEGRNDLPAISDQNQSSSAFTDLGDSRKLRRLRLTLFR